jgi:hypothetical protein
LNADLPIVVSLPYFMGSETNFTTRIFQGDKSLHE